MPANRLPAKTYLGFMPPAQQADTNFIEQWLGENEGVPPAGPEFPTAPGQDLSTAATPWATPATSTANQNASPPQPPTSGGQGGTWDVGQPVPPMPSGQLPEGYKWGIGSATMPVYAANGLQTGTKIVFFWEPKEAPAPAKPNIVTRDHLDEQGNTWEQDYIVNADGSMTPVPNMSPRLIEMAEPYDPESPDEPAIYTETSWDENTNQPTMRQFVYDMGLDGRQIKRYISAPVPTGPRQDIDLSRERFEYEQQQDALAYQQAAIKAAQEQQVAEKQDAYNRWLVTYNTEQTRLATEAANAREDRRLAEERAIAEADKRAAAIERMYVDPVRRYLQSGGVAPWNLADTQSAASQWWLDKPPSDVPFMLGSEAGRQHLARNMWDAGIVTPGGPVPWMTAPNGTRVFADAINPEEWTRLRMAGGTIGAFIPAKAVPPTAEQQAYYDDIRDRTFNTGRYTPQVAATPEENQARINALTNQRSTEWEIPIETARSQARRRF